MCIRDRWEYRGQTIDELRSHVKTFRTVFKYVVLVFGPAIPTSGVMMLGSDAPIDITSGMDSVLAKPGVVNDLSSAPDSPVGVTTAAAWHSLIVDNIWLIGDDVDKFAAGGTLITDDRPYTEYDLLRHLFGPKSPAATRENLLVAMPSSKSEGGPECFERCPVLCVTCGSTVWGAGFCAPC